MKPIPEELYSQHQHRANPQRLPRLLRRRALRALRPQAGGCLEQNPLTHAAPPSHSSHSHSSHSSCHGSSYNSSSDNASQWPMPSRRNLLPNGSISVTPSTDSTSS